MNLQILSQTNATAIPTPIIFCLAEFLTKCWDTATINMSIMKFWPLIGLTHTYFSLDEVEFDDVVSGYWYEYDDDLRYLGGSMIATAAGCRYIFESIE